MAHRLVLLAIATGLAAGPALAVQAEETTVIGRPVANTILVSYADLDLSLSDDVGILRQRVSGAARRLCFDGNYDSLAVVLDERRCFHTARADGYRQIDRAAMQVARNDVAGGQVAILLRR